MNLDEFLDQEVEPIYGTIERTIRQLKKEMKIDPESYTAPGDDSPSVDVRLCIDLKNDRPETMPSWILRTGPVDYDPYHSEYCAASCITPETEVAQLYNELLNDLEAE